MTPPLWPPACGRPASVSKRRSSTAISSPPAASSCHAPKPLCAWSARPRPAPAIPGRANCCSSHAATVESFGLELLHDARDQGNLPSRLAAFDLQDVGNPFGLLLEKGDDGEGFLPLVLDLIHRDGMGAMPAQEVGALLARKVRFFFTGHRSPPLSFLTRVYFGAVFFAAGFFAGFVATFFAAAFFAGCFAAVFFTAVVFAAFLAGAFFAGAFFFAGFVCGSPMVVVTSLTSSAAS